MRAFGEFAGVLSQVPKPGTWGTQAFWVSWRRTKAGPSTHHPRTEKRSGPLSLRMTPSYFVGELGEGEVTG
jgi:hypothetical protein